MPEWRIYYGDGARHSSDDGPAETAPATGVFGVVQRDPVNGKHVLTHFDYYCYDAKHSQWYGVDLFGLFDALCQGETLCRFGRWVPNAQHDALLNEMRSDPDFIGVGAWRQHSWSRNP